LEKEARAILVVEVKYRFFAEPAVPAASRKEK
jgi:hypothetical protein